MAIFIHIGEAVVVAVMEVLPPTSIYITGLVCLCVSVCNALVGHGSSQCCVKNNGRGVTGLQWSGPGRHGAGGRGRGGTGPEVKQGDGWHRARHGVMGGVGPDSVWGGAQLNAEQQQCRVMGGGSSHYVQASPPPPPGRWHGMVRGGAPFPSLSPPHFILDRQFTSSV